MYSRTLLPSMLLLTSVSVYFARRADVNYYIQIREMLQLTHSHTHTFNGTLSGTTRVSRYQKGKTNLDFTEARESEWQWHQLGHM